jgi:hypothetical protein
MTGIPAVTPATMIPMTGIPDPARMRGLGPVTADGDICAVTPCPFLVDPDVTRARSNRSFDGMPNRTYRYIDLRGSGVGVGTSADYQGKQKGQFYKFTLHMLVFKFPDLTPDSNKG